ncbi:hypothetical protein [Sanyastnella coralliicola]|uniref:hypothetical protein n=1 Tax=Sanyastnella coralliicola TaxID=3069118 RepID=UPI0027B97DD3|nr:hypothetical protein [Longitalea sp. SCSIO 12813]
MSKVEETIAYRLTRWVIAIGSKLLLNYLIWSFILWDLAVWTWNPIQRSGLVLSVVLTFTAGAMTKWKRKTKSDEQNFNGS